MDDVVEDVFVVVSLSDHVLSVSEVFDGVAFFAGDECFFVLHGLGVCFHFGVEGFDEVVDVAVEEHGDLLGFLVVVFFGDEAGAGGVAEVDVVAQTRFLGESFAGSQGEGVFDEPEDVVAFCGADEGSVVVSFFVFLSGDEDSRVVFVSDADVGVGLGVTEVDVVLRLVFLDEGVFEDEGFDFGVGDDVVDVVDVGDELGGFGVVVCFLKIAGDAFAQVVGLADVEDGPSGVFEEVAAGAGG